MRVATAYLYGDGDGCLAISEIPEEFDPIEILETIARMAGGRFSECSVYWMTITDQPNGLDDVPFFMPDRRSLAREEPEFLLDLKEEADSVYQDDNEYDRKRLRKISARYKWLKDAGITRVILIPEGRA